MTLNELIESAEQQKADFDVELLFKGGDGMYFSVQSVDVRFENIVIEGTPE
jgi:hypothetical protein